MKKHSRSYHKLFKATLATTVAAGAFVAVAPLSTNANDVVFKDLNKEAHYYEPVLDLSARGIVNGYGDGTYKPGNSVTRGQAAKILALILDLDTKNVKNPGFTDVKVTDAYYGPIAALAQAGIINGYDDKTFKPNSNLKRSQMAKIIAIGFDLKEETLTDKRFTDVKSSDAYAGYVQSLLTHNITTGTTPTTFGPNALVTRGQIASFVVRSEKAVSVKAPVEIKSEIVNITNNTVELADGTFRVQANLKSLFNTTNLAALKGAIVTVTAQDGLIGKVTSIELAASGTASKSLILDGDKATLAGNLKVTGDYVSVKNLLIEGNLEIGNKVKNALLGEGTTVKGKTNISEGASIVTINTSVTSLLIDTVSEVTVDGIANLGEVEIKSKDAKVTLGTDVKIGNLVLPAGVEAKDVIKNFDAVKGNIQKINGKDNAEVKPETPGDGSTGGGTTPPPAPTTPTTPTGNELLNQSIQDQLGKGNAAAGGAVGVSMAGNTFTVDIKNSNSTLNNFNDAAAPVFDAFKTNTVVNSTTMTITVGGQNIVISNDDINNDLDFDNVMEKALAKVGLSGTTNLNILKDKSITFEVSGTIDNKEFDTTYVFNFQATGN